MRFAYFSLEWYLSPTPGIAAVDLSESVRIYSANTITIMTRVQHSMEPLLADIPAGWGGSLEHNSDEQGPIRETPMQVLVVVTDS